MEAGCHKQAVCNWDAALTHTHKHIHTHTSYATPSRKQSAQATTDCGWKKISLTHLLSCVCVSVHVCMYHEFIVVCEWIFVDMDNNLMPPKPICGHDCLDNSCVQYTFFFLFRWSVFCILARVNTRSLESFTRIRRSDFLHLASGQRPDSHGTMTSVRPNLREAMKRLLCLCECDYNRKRRPLRGIRGSRSNVVNMQIMPTSYCAMKIDVN